MSGRVLVGLVLVLAAAFGMYLAFAGSEAEVELPAPFRVPRKLPREAVPVPKQVFDASGLAILARTEKNITELPLIKVLWHEGPYMAQVSAAHEEFWSLVSRNEWEPDTFRIFRRHVTRDHVVIDFGAWVGPTVLYAASLGAKHVWAIEGDPAAFAELRRNVAANSALASRVTLIPGAVVAETALEEAVRMRSVEAGNSMSSMGAVYRMRRSDRVTDEWLVAGRRLSHLMAAVMQLAPTGTARLFIKVDVESTECDLLASWVPWLEQWRGPRPTLYVSMHGSIQPCSLRQYRTIYRLCSLYRHVSPDFCLEADKSVAQTGEFLLSDTREI